MQTIRQIINLVRFVFDILEFQSFIIKNQYQLEMIISPYLRKMVQSLIRLKDKYMPESRLDFSLIQESQLNLANELQKSQQQNKLQIPLQRYDRLQAYFLRFLNSKSQYGRVNGQHLTFVTGARNIGKTSFINMNLKNFVKLKERVGLSKIKTQEPEFTILKSPEFLQNESQEKIYDNQHYLIIKYDFGKNGAFNFAGFIHHFKSTIITQIIKLNNLFTNQSLLNFDIITQIMLSTKTPEYLFIYLKHFISSVLNDTDILLLDQEHKKFLFQHLQKYWHSDPTQYFHNHFRELVNIFERGISKDQTQTTILLFMSVLIKIQQEYCPIQYKNGYYESGIETTNFLFDILNFLCGLGQVNYKIFQHQLTKNNKKQQEIIDQQYISPLIKNNSNYILNGNHIDVVLCFMNVDQLSCSETLQFINFYDNILVRTSNSSNLRSHFPIVIQLADNLKLSYLQNMGRMSLENPGILQIPGYYKYLVNSSNLPKVLSQKSIDKLFPVLGRCPKVWTQAIILLSQGSKISQFTLGSHRVFKKYKIILQAKINHIYCHPQNIKAIDSGDLKFKIHHFLRLLKRMKGNMYPDKPFYYMRLFRDPAFQSFFKEGILFNHFYLHSMELWINQILKSCRFIDKVKYLKWNLKNQDLSYTKRDLRYTEYWETETFKYYKFPLRRYDYHINYYYGPSDDYQLQYKKFVLVNPIVI